MPPPVTAVPVAVAVGMKPETEYRVQVVEIVVAVVGATLVRFAVVPSD